MRANLRNIGVRHVPGRNQQPVQQYNLNTTIRNVQNPTQELVNLRKQFVDQEKEMNVLILVQRKLEILSGSRKALLDAKCALVEMQDWQMQVLEKKNELGGIKSDMGEMQSRLQEALSNTKIVQDFWTKEINDASTKFAALQNEINYLSTQVDKQTEVKGYELPNDVQADDKLKSSAKQFENTKIQVDQSKTATQKAVKNALDVCDEINGLIGGLKDLAQQVADSQRKLQENTQRAEEWLRAINNVKLDGNADLNEALQTIKDAVEKNNDLLDGSIDVHGVQVEQLQKARSQLNLIDRFLEEGCETNLDDINVTLQGSDVKGDEGLQVLLGDVKSKLKQRENMGQTDIDDKDTTEMPIENQGVSNQNLLKGASNILSEEKLWQDVSDKLKQIGQNSTKFEKLQKISEQLKQPAQLTQALGDLQALLRQSGFVTIVDEENYNEDPLQNAMDRANKSLEIDESDFD